MEHSLLIIKPDAMQRRLAGKVLSRIEQKGLLIKALKMIKLPTNVVETHYEQHVGKPFYEPLVEFMQSSPVIIAVVAGKNAISTLRMMVGNTACFEASPGTIRGDMGISNRYNLVHASDSAEAAEREINLFFKPEDIIEWSTDDSQWFLY